MKKLLVLGTVLLTSIASHAIGNIPSTAISAVYVREDRVDVYLVSPVGNPAGCPGPTNIVVINGDQFKNSKAMIASALGAHLSSRPISGWVGGCTPDGVGFLTALTVER